MIIALFLSCLFRCYSLSVKQHTCSPKAADPIPDRHFNYAKGNDEGLVVLPSATMEPHFWYALNFLAKPNGFLKKTQLLQDLGGCYDNAESDVVYRSSSFLQYKSCKPAGQWSPDGLNVGGISHTSRSHWHGSLSLLDFTMYEGFNGPISRLVSMGLLLLWRLECMGIFATMVTSCPWACNALVIAGAPSLEHAQVWANEHGNHENFEFFEHASSALAEAEMRATQIL